MIARIISGGQAGADRGALDAAIEVGVEHGGWCPLGRVSEDGPIPTRYQLRQTDRPGYRWRTRFNVRDSEATIIFTIGPITPGSRLTLRCCMELHKQVRHVDLHGANVENIVRDIVDWLDTCKRFGTPVHTLNIAGSRESKAPGIQAKVRDVLTRVLSDPRARRPSSADGAASCSGN